MQNESITPFIFGEQPVRSIMRSGEPWFVAKDICLILGLGNASMAVKGNPKSGNIGLDADEAAIMNHDTLGGAQDVLVVNESGLYALIFKSRKAEARRFRKWVTSEVLPTIRRSGSYSPGHNAFLGLLKEQISLGVPAALAARIAAKLSPAAAPAPRGSTLYIARGKKTTMQPVDDLIDVMEEDRRYTTDELLVLLPKDHRIHSMKEGRGKSSALGRMLHTYVSRSLLQVSIIGGRSYYTRPRSIVDFAAP